MSRNDYIYAVARIRTKELSLLSGPFLEQLLALPDEAQCLRLLREHGWSDGTAEEMLSAETEKTWSRIAELVDDLSVFDVFLYRYDYHNLKAAVKASCIPESHPGIYAARGTLPAEQIAKAVAENDYSLLPERMRRPAKEAKDALLHTGDGQICDCIIDRAALEAIAQAGRETGVPLLERYGELTAAAADVKTAVRAARTGKDRDFLSRSLAPCASLDIGALAQAALNGFPAVCAFLETTAYADAVPELKISTAAFERWCDDIIIRSIRPQLANPFGVEPLAAYILARESEIRTVRIILSAKRNGLPEKTVRERVRETYV